MFDFGSSEIVLILVVALVVLGPKRLPAVAKTIGSTLRKIRTFTDGVRLEMTNQINDLDVKSIGSSLMDSVENLREDIEDSLHQIGDNLQSVGSNAWQNLPSQRNPEDFFPQYTPPMRNLTQKSHQIKLQRNFKTRRVSRLRGSSRL